MSNSPAPGEFFFFTSPEGLYHCAASDADILGFLDHCSAAGVTRLATGIDSTQDGPSARFGLMAREAQARGIKVVAYLGIGWGGDWRWRDTGHSSLGEPWPDPDLSSLARRRPDLFSRTREGKIWLEYGWQSNLGKMGILNLAAKDVRAFDTTRLVHVLTTYGLDGVQVVWVPSPRPPDNQEPNRSHTVDWLLGEDGYWAYGYEPETISLFRERYGLDPRTLPTSDERWVEMRCEAVMDSIRELRVALNATGHPCEFSVQGVSGIFGSPEAGRRVNFDWSKMLDEGLIDAIYPRYPANYPLLKLAFDRHTIECMCEDIIRLQETVNGRAKLYVGLLLPTYANMTREIVEPHDAAQAILRAIEAVVSTGMHRVGFYCGHRFQTLGLWPYAREMSDVVLSM